MSIKGLRCETALRRQIAKWRRKGRRIAFVPTMGALHEGHLSLIALAHAHADRVIASIYVNPTQFGPDEDLAAYPRDEAADLAKLESAGCHACYLPGELYADDHATRVEVDTVRGDLEGEHRPGHFEGVALVLTKFFNRVAPDVAVFGEKDYQQLALVRQLVRDLDFPIAIVGAPIARDDHGLALSSRNRYFDEAGLATARKLNARMRDCVEALERGMLPETALRHLNDGLLSDGFDQVDYAVLRDAVSLKAAEPDSEARLLVVARVGKVRLLDNMAVRLP